jgi:vacuolar iron transporter family protein
MISWLHKKIGEYLKDAVYAANDGVVTTFAVVAGVVGAGLEPFIILVLGFANLFADGLSMAGGNYLGTKSESDLYKKVRAQNVKLLESDKDGYKKRLVNFLREKGGEEENIDQLAEAIVHNNNFAIDVIMHEELGLVEQDESRPVKGALMTLIAFVLAGLVPLLPYVFLSQAQNTFLYASIFTAGALFAIGALRSSFMDRTWLSTGFEMLVVGGLAASIAYGAGFFIKQVIS